MLLSSFFRTALRYSLSAFSQCEKIAGFPFFLTGWHIHNSCIQTSREKITILQSKTLLQKLSTSRAIA